ncbi:MAG: hypothetical protein J6V74_00910 [Bacteroidales bacterium]|nr:hypothetical protein [Bacteroidales bacterium]
MPIGYVRMQYACIAVHIGVGSSLLVLDQRAMREPHKAGRVTGTIPRFFIFSSNHFAWESAKGK